MPDEVHGVQTGLVVLGRDLYGRMSISELYIAQPSKLHEQSLLEIRHPKDARDPPPRLRPSILHKNFSDTVGRRIKEALEKKALHHRSSTKTKNEGRCKPYPYRANRVSMIATQEQSVTVGRNIAVSLQLLHFGLTHAVHVLGLPYRC